MIPIPLSVQTFYLSGPFSKRQAKYSRNLPSTSSQVEPGRRGDAGGLQGQPDERGRLRQRLRRHRRMQLRPHRRSQPRRQVSELDSIDIHCLENDMNICIQTDISGHQ